MSTEIDKSDVNLRLLTAFKNSNFIIVGEKALQAANATKLQSESLLESDQTISGIKSISNINVAPSIAQLDTILPATSVNDSDDSDINLITGTRSQPGRLNKVIGSGSPQAVGQSLATVTDRNAFQYRNELKSIAVDDAKPIVLDIDIVLNEGGVARTGFSNSINDFNLSINNLIGNNTNSLLGNCILNIQNGIFPILNSIVPNISNTLTQTVVGLLLGNRKVEAVRLLEKNSNQSAAEIEKKLNEVPVSQSNVVDPQTKKLVGNKTVPAYELTSQERLWLSENTPTSGSYRFDVIGTKEELIAELRNTSRDFTEFVVHWTESFKNQNLTAEDIHEWHLDKGYTGIGYHYIITRSGILQRGRPLNIIGDHAPEFNHNQYSIGIAFVGGYNCSIGTKNPDRFLSSESFTQSQWTTFDMFCEAFYTVLPAGQAWGHNDVSDMNTDPGFNVQKFVKQKFNKENIVLRGDFEGSSLSFEQLADFVRSTTGENLI
jgi:N-acetylmuramoyl-L-alanine amidase